MTNADASTPTGTGTAAAEDRPRQLDGQARRAGGRRVRRLDAGQLAERVDEEIGRASRHGTGLCCLVIGLDDFAEISAAHGQELAERALLHAGDALSVELRRFDRVGRPSESELAIVLPGAGASEGECVARRAIARLHAIKLEIGRVRRPLSVSVGIAAWRAPWSAQRLLEEARAAAALTSQVPES